MEDFSAPWLRRLLTVVMLAGLVLLGFLVLDPFVVPVVWAAILAYVSWPGYEWLLGKCRGRSIIAALAMTTVVSAAVIVPLAWLTVVVRLELVHAYSETQRLLVGGELPPALLKLPWIGDQLHDLAARAAQDPHALGAELRKIADHSFEQIAHVIGGISRNAAKLLLTVVSLFFVYRDGARIAEQLAGALEQMLGPRVHNYLKAIGQTVKAVVYGLVLAALVQGVLVGIGYWLAGVGAPVFLAALTTVCGLIPFAAPTIWVCVTAWLLLEGSTVAGVGLLIWGGVVMGWTDHIVRPFLISREAQIPFLVVLFGVLGGLAAFGLVGLFVGPVILAVLLAIWREWQLETRRG
jgi:predicted PurR-regulated permease PerM